MEVIIKPTPEDLAKIAADDIVRLLARKPTAVLGLATGSSPLPIYQELVRRHKAGEVSFAQAQAFILDEYVGLPADHPEAYRNVIRREFTDQVDFGDGAVHSPDVSAPVQELARNCQEYEAAMAAAGGVDLQLLGVGTDGHIAFNEPASSLSSRTRVKMLAQETRRDNARFFGGDLSAVPYHAVTQGLATIMEARQLILIATGEGKAQAVGQLVEGPVAALWPVTILQHHPHAKVLIDDAAASLLQRADYYRENHEHKMAWQRQA